jgi:hypothetical protein
MSIYSWETWIICILLILVIMWIYFKIIGEVPSTSTYYEETYRTQTETIVDSNGNNVKSIISSSRDYIPDTKVKFPEINSITSSEAIELDTISLNKKEISKKQSKGEAECKKILEKMYNIEFETQVRNLEILKNPLTGRYLELDLYCPKLNPPIACEFHGRQHYEVVNKFHRNGEKDLKYQQWKDNFKIDACDKAGIYLITVPYNVPLKSMESFIEYYRPEKYLGINVARI